MWDFTERPLVDLFLDRLDGEPELDLQEHEPHFPELTAAFVPPDFGHELRYPSRIRQHDSELEIELSMTFWPGTAPTHQTECSAGRQIRTADSHAEHFYLEIAEELQGQGIGRRLVRSSAGLYARLGVPTINLMAIDIGRYAWAMCGFQPDGEDWNRLVWEGVREAAIELGFELGDEFEYLFDLDQLDETVTQRELLEAFGDGGQLPPSLADDLDRPIRLGKALLLCGRTSECYGNSI